MAWKGIWDHPMASEGSQCQSKGIKSIEEHPFKAIQASGIQVHARRSFGCPGHYCMFPNAPVVFSLMSLCATNACGALGGLSNVFGCARTLFDASDALDLIL